MKKHDMGKLSNRIPELRARYRITQKELADKIGVSRQTIIAIEKGNYSPSLVLAFEIAITFEVQIEEVFQYEQVVP